MSQSHSDNIYAIDLGTTKFCFASMSIKSSGAPLIESISVPSAGMKKGMVIDQVAAKDALNGLITLAEKETKMDIRKVAIGIAGSHLKGRVVESETVSTYGSSISESFLLELKDEVEAKFRDETTEILHVIPIEYFLDSRPPTTNPLNLSGRSLKGTFYLIESDRDYARDIINLCNQCGLEVTSLMAEPYASASVIASDQEKKEGVIVADIGGGTTDGIIFKDARVKKAFTINVGGKLMTSDLSIGLNIPLNEAEKVKHHFGLDPKTSPLSIESTSGATVEISFPMIERILGARVQELGKLIQSQIERGEESYIKNVAFTGGGSEVKDIAQYLSKNMKMKLECRNPSVSDLHHSEKAKVMSARFATVAGLLYLEYLRRIERGHSYNQSRTSRYFSSFFTWLRELS